MGRDPTKVDIFSEQVMRGLACLLVKHAPTIAADLVNAGWVTVKPTGIMSSCELIHTGADNGCGS